MEEFNNWLSSALESLSLNDEAYVGYIGGIMEEDTSTTDEKVEGIVDFLQAATV